VLSASSILAIGAGCSDVKNLPAGSQYRMTDQLIVCNLMHHHSFYDNELAACLNDTQVCAFSAK